ncbi:MAG: class I SAM-dependent methyltransferase [bacterium]
MKYYDRIALLYDLSHHLQTLWQDSRYRTDAAKCLSTLNGGAILDLGTGTASSLIEILKRNPDSVGVGIDSSFQMLQMARKKLMTENLMIRAYLIMGDIEKKLPFLDNMFDAIVSVYGIGGLSQISNLLDEIIRISRPNARITMAEMTTPPMGMIKRLVHLKFVEPWIRYFWKFRDQNLIDIFEKLNVKIDINRHYNDRILGSTTLISGVIKKTATQRDKNKLT